MIIKDKNMLLVALADSLDISIELRNKAEKEYKQIGNWLDNDVKISMFSPDIYPQGSFRIQTVIKPVNDEEDYDIDIVCELRKGKNKGNITQEELKNLIGNSLKEYEKNHPFNIEEGKRCWKLQYPTGTGFHMDVLPAIPDINQESLYLTKPVSTKIAITDKKHPNFQRLKDDWLTSDPKRYSEWFKQTMMDIRKQISDSLIGMKKYAKVEEIPEYEIKTPLQQAIQILKRHRDIMFEDDPDNKPSSIMITTLAALLYNNQSDLSVVLDYIINNLPKHIQFRGNIYWLPNPINAEENLIDRWETNDRLRSNFYNWSEKIKQDYYNFKMTGNIDYVTKSFGENIVKKAQVLYDSRQSLESKSIINEESVRSLFNVQHKQKPLWNLKLRNTARIEAKAEKNGIKTSIESNGQTLPKDTKLEFMAITDTQGDFEVFWQVVNTGYEASAKNDLRGNIFLATRYMNKGVYQNEHTQYKGMHWIECFIVQNGICIARSGEFIINVA